MLNVDVIKIERELRFYMIYIYHYIQNLSKNNDLFQKMEIYIRFNLVYQNTMKYLLRKKYYEKNIFKKLFGIN